MEGAATTVYAQGGRGNTRLIAWEGEKTLTFTITDALLSPEGFSILSGAGLVPGYEYDSETGEISETPTTVHFHTTTTAIADTDGIDLSDVLGSKEEAPDEKIDSTAPFFVIITDPDDGSLTGQFIKGLQIDEDGKKITGTELAKYDGQPVMIDYYIAKKGNTVSELQIDAENFAGYFYVEADTLFRRQSDGFDLPANITFPNVKIQSNFTFSMASTGDPSTFDFTMDAFPGYTLFDKTKKVLCVIQILSDTKTAETRWKTVMNNHDSDTTTFKDQVDSKTAVEDNLP